MAKPENTPAASSAESPDRSGVFLGSTICLVGLGVILAAMAALFVLPTADSLWAAVANIAFIARLSAVIVGFALVVVGAGLAIPRAHVFLLEVLHAVSPRKRGSRAEKTGKEPAGESSAISQVEPTPPEEESELRADDQSTGLPGRDVRPIEIGGRWALSRGIRRPIFDLIGPAYLLDNTFHFVDWNPAFDEIVAKPLNLHRGDHVEALVVKLEDRDDVIERSLKIFKPPYPLVDSEPLTLQTDKYGKVIFHKLAAQIPDDFGNVRGWSISLDVTQAEQEEKIWEDVKARLIEYVNWSKYAVSYDKLLMDFPEYTKLLDLVISKIEDAQICADLGAGTGNATIKLLRDKTDREVWAIEPNEVMLEFLASKVERSDNENGTNFAERLYIAKSPISRCDEIGGAHFDAAVMTNVLYAVENPLECLRNVNRMLKDGGILALSTSTNETDVDQLFGAIRKHLINNKEFESKRENWEDAHQRHIEMLDDIHRDTADDIRAYLDQAGFDVIDWHAKEYLDTVVVVKAIKR